jgi:hypothetical protein
MGILLLIIVAGGGAVAAVRPRYFSALAGVLLGATLVANADMALNHPALIELLDQESEQRLELAGLLNVSREDAMTSAGNGRSEQQQDPPELLRSLPYLLYGRWLLVWAGLGVVYGGTAALRPRLLALGRWTVGGVVVAGLFCSPRLLAEYYWQHAKLLESEGRMSQARSALGTAVFLFPELERLERTWKLAGKLDYGEGRTSSQERFFRAGQMAGQRDWISVLTATNLQLEPTTSAADDHLTLSAFPETFSASDLLEDTLTSALDEGPPGSPPPPSIYMEGSKLEARRARALSDDLVAKENGGPAVRYQGARLWANAAVEHTLWGPVYPDAGLCGYWPPQHLTAAEDAWRRALHLAPKRADAAYCLGTVRARTHPERPEFVEAEFARMLPWLADEILRSDVRITLGHAYFGAGQMGPARWHYMRSLDDFNLPKLINVRGQKAAGGL